MGPGEDGHREGRRLRSKIELVRPVLGAAGHRLLGHPRIDALYPEYLLVSHSVVRASVPLMEAAASRAEAMGEPAAGRLARYLRQHIAEELDHDEWLLEDLHSLGVDRATVLNRPPPAMVAALVGAQYYWLLHYHPIALLGYMAVLEGNPPSIEQIDALMATTGLPRQAFRTLVEHAEVDPGHGDQIFAMLDDLVLSEELSTVLGLSAMHTVITLVEVIDGIVDGCAEPARDVG